MTELRRDVTLSLVLSAPVRLGDADVSLLSHESALDGGPAPMLDGDVRKPSDQAGLSGTVFTGLSVRAAGSFMVMATAATETPEGCVLEKPPCEWLSPLTPAITKLSIEPAQPYHTHGLCNYGL